MNEHPQRPHPVYQQAGASHIKLRKRRTLSWWQATGGDFRSGQGGKSDPTREGNYTALDSILISTTLDWGGPEGNLVQQIQNQNPSTHPHHKAQRSKPTAAGALCDHAKQVLKVALSQEELALKSHVWVLTIQTFQFLNL